MNEAGAHPVLVKLSDEGQTVAPTDVDIRGRRVHDRNDVDLGRIQNLLVDTVHHKVRMLRVEHGGILGFGASASFVPVEAITAVTDDVVYIDQTRERVANAPRYDPDVVEAPLTFPTLYGYYGYVPFGGPGE